MFKLLKIFLITISLAIFASSCSESQQLPEPSESENALTVQSSCPETDFDAGARWIKGQLKAFTKPDPKYAYGFASEDFRSTTSISQFADVISGQYSMLLDATDSEIYSCDSNGDFFLFGVKVMGADGKSYWMEYLLSKINGNWGVDGATITPEVQT